MYAPTSLLVLILKRKTVAEARRRESITLETEAGNQRQATVARWYAKDHPVSAHAKWFKQRIPAGQALSATNTVTGSVVCAPAIIPAGERHPPCRAIIAFRPLTVCELERGGSGVPVAHDDLPNGGDVPNWSVMWARASRIHGASGSMTTATSGELFIIIYPWLLLVRYCTP